ncbi:MAG: phosphate ABC transporter substrate-binding protein [Syntrophomonadaceae bacterium]
MRQKIGIMVVLISLLMMSIIAGCSNTNSDADKQNVKAPEQNVTIKVGGSSTLAPIIAKCADDFTEEYKTWNKVDSSLPEEGIVIFVSTGGSGFGMKSALDGTFDLGMVSKTLKDEEKEQFKEGEIIQLGSDVLDIAVNPKNPVAKVKPDLSKEEIKAIFSGNIKTWKELDPALPDRPIVVCVRDLGGGASEVFDKAIMEGTPISNQALQIPSMGALAGKVMDNQDAIGYVSSGLVNQNADKLTALKVDGIAPTVENITSGKYQIGRPLLLMSKDKLNAREQLFVDYLKSDKGRTVIEDLGYIPPAK